MSLVKTIHSDVLRNQLHPDESREKRHAFLTGIHSAAATIGRYKGRGDQLDEAISEIGEIIEEIDNGRLAEEHQWNEILSRAKVSVRKANDALSILPKASPPVVQDLTVEELLNLKAFPDNATLRDVFHGLWEEGADVSKYTGKYAETLLASLKAAGYVRIVIPDANS